MKTCFKCNVEKQLSEFYRHPGMKDGYLNKCKQCTKADAKKNRESKLEYYSEYERKRNKSIKRKTQKLNYQRNRRKRNPEKYKTRNATSNAIRDGKLIKMPCEICGNQKSEAHHNDYSDPLNITWLCFKHHREKHGQTVIC